jgi:hypothetical protein
MSYVLVHRSISLRPLRNFLMKTLAFVMALAFAAPLAAQAQTYLTPHQQLVQKVQSTYHTSFPNNGN